MLDGSTEGHDLQGVFLCGWSMTRYAHSRSPHVSLVPLVDGLDRVKSSSGTLYDNVSIDLSARFRPKRASLSFRVQLAMIWHTSYTVKLLPQKRVMPRNGSSHVTLFVWVKQRSAYVLPSSVCKHPKMGKESGRGLPTSQRRGRCESHVLTPTTPLLRRTYDRSALSVFLTVFI